VLIERDSLNTFDRWIFYCVIPLSFFGTALFAWSLLSA
jgi:hypothetical protein